MACEGITHALLSGHLAARALLDGDFKEPRTREAYESLLENHILKEIRWGRMIARILYDAPRLRGWLFRHFGREMVEGLADVFMGEQTYQEMVLSPGTYLKRVRQHFV